MALTRGPSSREASSAAQARPIAWRWDDSGSEEHGVQAKVLPTYHEAGARRPSLKTRDPSFMGGKGGEGEEGEKGSLRRKKPVGASRWLFSILLRRQNFEVGGKLGKAESGRIM